MTQNADILDKARKIKALAERGVGGEKIAAQEALKRYCEKHNLNPDKLQPDFKFTKQRGTVDFDEFIHEIFKNVNLTPKQKALTVIVAFGISLLDEYLNGRQNNQANQKREGKKAETPQGGADDIKRHPNAQVALDGAKT